MTKIEFHSKKSRFKESNCVNRGHLLNRDFTVIMIHDALISSLIFRRMTNFRFSIGLNLLLLNIILKRYKIKIMTFMALKY